MAYKLKDRQMLTFSLDGEDAVRLQNEARRRRIAVSALVREAVIAALPKEEAAPFK